MDIRKLYMSLNKVLHSFCRCNENGFVMKREHDLASHIYICSKKITKNIRVVSTNERNKESKYTIYHDHIRSHITKDIESSVP